MWKKVLVTMMLTAVLTSSAVVNAQSQKDEGKTAPPVKDEVPKDLKIIFYAGGNAPWTTSNKLTLQSDGQCSFQHYPAMPERKKSPLPKEEIFTIKTDDLKFIWKVIVENKFYELDEKYDGGAVDGSFAVLTITADHKEHTVRTTHIALKHFDLICLAINKVVPEKYRPHYNEIYGRSYDEESNAQSQKDEGKTAPPVKNEKLKENNLSDSEKLVDGNNEFALNLYAALSWKDDNIFFSPYSISSALAMTYAGARGNTETQMAQTLHSKLGQGLLHPLFAKLNKDLAADKTKGYQLNIANALWGQQGYKFLPAFLALIEKSYGAGIKEVDFSKDTEGARKTINAWVEKETQDKIKDLIKAGGLNNLTRLVLTNAIYFKGDWNFEFNKKMTGQDSFTLLKGGKIKTPLMYQRQNFKYAEMEDAQIIELPYVVSSTMSMVIFLPKKADGFTNFEKTFDLKNIEQWMSKLDRKKVNVYLPKFKMDFGCELNEILGSLGMVDAFNGSKADFSGISAEKPGLSISKVIHKAFVDVNEEGTEAAAATAIGMSVGCATPPPKEIEFRADRPFIFMIRDMRSGSILFIGRVMDPRS
ncbi:MAG: serpin family protein [Planctomycetota bacterium]